MQTRSSARCANKQCQTETTSRLLQCARCRACAYCSKSCQRLHWPDHRDVCCKALREELTNKTLAFFDATAQRATHGTFAFDTDLLNTLEELDVDSIPGKKVEVARSVGERALTQAIRQMPIEQQIIATTFTKFLSGKCRSDVIEFMKRFHRADFTEQLAMARETGLEIEICPVNTP